MYLVTEIIHSRKRLYGVLSMLLLTLFLVTVDVMVQFTWGKSIVHHATMIFGRVSGPMNHPNDLGTLLVTVLPLVLILIFTTPSWIRITGISILFLFLLNALGLTASRGAWVSFMVSIVALGIFLKNKKLMVLIIFILAVFSWIYGMHCLNTRIDMYNNVPGPNSLQVNPSWGLHAVRNFFELFFGPSGRESYWGTAVNVIKHYPWFGCGYSAYVQTLRDLHVGHEEYPHNSLLQITAELGFLGLILYGWFFTALYLQIKNVLSVVSRERDLFLLGCGISSGILAWLIHSFMDTAWASLQLSVLWWLFIGIMFSLVSAVPNHKAPRL